MLDKKKQRGQRRRLTALLKRIDAFVPFQEPTKAYEHFHVPCDLFIQSPKTAGHIKTIFCKKWLETAEGWISQKPADLPFCKVIAVIDEPCYWSSQIVIFYRAHDYDTFWDRNGPEQTWEALKGDRSFAKERHFTSALSERGYTERIFEDGDCFESTLWFYGDVQ